jgi:Methane oxygenase PmoA
MHPRLILPLLFACTSSLALADLTVERSSNGAVVKIDGQFFTEYVTLSGNRPILWPIQGPTGAKMTRDYPMIKRDDELHDHVHQRSLWFAHMEVNGWNFWAEKGSFAEGKKAYTEQIAKVGLQQHREFSKLEGGKDKATIVSITDWLSPDGKKQLEDERRLTFSGNDQARIIDFDIDLKATEGPVVFGDNKDGVFGIRIPSTMDLKQASKDAAHGSIVSSEGRRDDAAWGYPAAWVDYNGPVDGKTLGVAILNHPSSFRYPTTWHVRDYGLFAANPFGLADFAKGHKDPEPHPNGEHTLAKGDTLRFRYRVIFHQGDEQAAKIADAWTTYSK